LQLPRITASTVVKLVVASLCVGLILAYFETDPLQVLAGARDRLAGILGGAADWVLSNLQYVLLGAVIVVPIWLISYVWRAIRGR
jgi:hypothetical protein